MKIVTYTSLSLSLLLIFIFIHPSIANIQVTNKLVEQVCEQTSNYSFCVESLYRGDPGTPHADRYKLSFISFGLAYLNATTSQSHIADQLLNNATAGSQTQKALQRCASDYNKAVSALEVAYGDLNSETFFELANLAGVAANSADDCQAALIKGTFSYSSLTIMNENLKGLCDICVVLSKLFTGS